MAGNLPKFMLFPHMVLSNREYRHLSLLLPGLSVLQVVRPAATPEWLSPMVEVWPVITEQKRLEAIRLALKGFQEYAAVHGDESALASLSLDQIAKGAAESRLRIQTELKGKEAAGVDRGESLLLEAAVFLEMARELDEKEIEVEAGLARMDSLEGEFREILGISDDEGLEDTLETISPPLRGDKTGLSHMLPKRIESWFRLLSGHMPPALPVLVTTEPVIEEFLDCLRAKGGAAGNKPEPNRIPLASIPALDGLANEDYLCLMSNPEASDMLTSYWQELAKVILAPGDPKGREALAQAADSLQDYLTAYGREVGLSNQGTISMDLVLGDALSWNAIGKRFGRVEGTSALAGEVLPDEPVKIVVWRS